MFPLLFLFFGLLFIALGGLVIVKSEAKEAKENKKNIDFLLRKDTKESFLENGKRKDEIIINDASTCVHDFVEYDSDVIDIDKNNWYGTYVYKYKCKCGAEKIKKVRALI